VVTTPVHGRPRVPRPRPDDHRRTAVVTGLASDAHTWNLVFLQLFIEELGYEVVNLGSCVPDDLLVEVVRRRSPDVVVVSTVNGHGYHDGLRVIRKLRCGETGRIPVVIGGKFGITATERASRLAELVAAGFDAVFDDGDGRELAALRGLFAQLPAGGSA
jgi:methylaspartate mutase sigma subunit